MVADGIGRMGKQFDYDLSDDYTQCHDMTMS